MVCSLLCADWFEQIRAANKRRCVSLFFMGSVRVFEQWWCAMLEVNIFIGYIMFKKSMLKVSVINDLLFGVVR